MAKQKPKRRKHKPREVAAEYGISVNKVLHLIHTGQLRAINVAPSLSHRPQFLIDDDDLSAFEKARRVVPSGGMSTTEKLRRKAAGDVTEYF